MSLKSVCELMSLQNLFSCFIKILLLICLRGYFTFLPLCIPTEISCFILFFLQKITIIFIFYLNDIITECVTEGDISPPPLVHTNNVQHHREGIEKAS